MKLRLLHQRTPARPAKAKRPPRGGAAPALGPSRPIRHFSLLLPPTFPDDRR